MAKNAVAAIVAVAISAASVSGGGKWPRRSALAAKA